MSQTAEEIKKHVRVDVAVLAAFAVLTLAHVAIARGAASSSGLIIATLYAARIALVVFYFAYLTKGKSFIHITLLLTAAFLVFLLSIAFMH